jgi:fused signal recognition particle receptor
MVEQMRLEFKQKEKAIEYQSNQQQMQADMAKFQAEQQQTLKLEQERMAQEAALRQYEADKQAQTTLQVEQMRLGGTVDIEAARLKTQREAKLIDVQANREMEEFRAQTAAQQAAEKPEDDSKEMFSEALTAMATAIDRMSKPKKVIRDESGRVVGVKPID